MITSEERKRTELLCKNNPYKAMEIAELIFKELQMMTIREFALKSKYSERTIYNAVSDIENSKFELAIFCNDKYIPGALNKDLFQT